MQLHFKDKRIEEIFNERKNIKEEEGFFEEDGFLSEDIKVSSSLDLLEDLEERTLPKEDSILLPLETIKISQLDRIESTQNNILKLLESTKKQTVNKIKREERSFNDEDILRLNLQLFNKRLTILSTKTEDKDINELLIVLEEITEHLSSNSFNIFNQENSLIQIALKKIQIIGMGDSIFNKSIDETEQFLKKIDTISNMDIFEKSYGYANIFLEKNMLLNAITLLNETVGMYIVESVKNYSEDIRKYTYIIGEEDRFKLYLQARDFFDALFLTENKKMKQIVFFPHHSFEKEIDKKIAKKFRKIEQTWKHKGDEGVFQKYVFISKRIRLIRNSVAHGDMETRFKFLKEELKNLNQDFRYLAIQKNILKGIRFKENDN